MGIRKKSDGIYVAHRTSQREKILEVAETLFIERGIESVSISDIAAASRLTRATVYKYFPNLKEIAFDIFQTVVSTWHERNKQVWSYPGNGFQRIEKFLTSICDHLFQSPDEARFLAEFNNLYAKKWPSSQVLEVLEQTVGEDKNLILKCIRQGIEDGSVRSDLDPGLTMAAIHNLNAGLLSRLGQMGGKLQEEFGIGADRIFSEIYRIFTNGIKMNSDSGKRKSMAPADSPSRRKAHMRKFKK
jgi:AcrR family transcriptional regulator